MRYEGKSEGYSDRVRAVCAQYPHRVHWLKHEDGRAELRLHGDGLVYNFAADRWSDVPQHAVVIPDAWRLVLDRKPVDA